MRALSTLTPLTAAGDGCKPDIAVTFAYGQRIGYRIVDKASSRFLQRLDVPVSYQLAPIEAERLLTLTQPVTPGITPPAEPAPAP